MDNIRTIIIICPDCGSKRELAYDIDFVTEKQITRFNLEDQCRCGIGIVARVYISFAREPVGKLSKMIIEPTER